MSETLCRFLTITAGTLYPAYRSHKAVRTKDRREYVKWMMYWIVFAIYSFLENILDLLLAFWFPFYYQLKIIFIFWLLSPWTKGASILYRKWVHPTLNQHEPSIDELLEKAKSESYNQLLRFGSQSLIYAKDIVTEAAVRGQQQFTNQIQRSYSANDVGSERDGSRRRLKVDSEIEEVDESTASDNEHESEKSNESIRKRTTRSRSRSRSRTATEDTDSMFYSSSTMPRSNRRSDNRF